MKYTCLANDTNCFPIIPNIDIKGITSLCAHGNDHSYTKYNVGVHYTISSQRMHRNEIT